VLTNISDIYLEFSIDSWLRKIQIFALLNWQMAFIDTLPKRGGEMVY